MTISRSQQPRQMYGLGSLVKSVKKAVKNVVKSPIGKAAILGFGGAGLMGMGPLSGLGSLMGAKGAGKFLYSPVQGSGGFLSGLASKFKGMSALGKAGLIGGASLLGGLFAGKTEEEIEELKRNPETLKVYLRDYYTRLNPNASSEEVDAFVTTNTAEYYSTGGRVGYQQGGQPAQQLGSAQGGTPLYADVIEYLKRSNMPSGQTPQGPAEIISPEMMMDDMGGGVMSAYTGSGSSGGITGASTTPISTGGGSSGTGILQATSGTTQPATTSPSNIVPTTTAAPTVSTSKTSSGMYIDPTGTTMEEYFSRYTPYWQERMADELGGKTGEEYKTAEQAYKKAKSDFDYSVYKAFGFEDYVPEDYVFGNIDNLTNSISSYNTRMGYKSGNVVDQASGIMGLPKRTNSAGVKELDLRKSGGFIPPVGVKEKADDIPAMLSNNEFVFTADAVRGMGDGDVNKGAQRMYTMMKRLEKGGRV